MDLTYSLQEQSDLSGPRTVGMKMEKKTGRKKKKRKTKRG